MAKEHKATVEGSDAVPAPQGRIAGVPFDFRRPSLSKLRARWWNPDDPRVFTPKTFGMGWDINLHRLVHPLHRPHAKASDD